MTDIAGATSNTYVLTVADIGSVVTARVTATNSVGNASATAAGLGPVSGAATAPSNSVLPVITGSPVVGQTLNISNGTWSGTAPITYARQWKRGGVNISGATGTSYTLVTADLGATITCTVTATNAIGNASATSLPTAAVTAAAPVNSVLPVITGSTVQGGVLTTTTGTWSGSPTYAYQWKRGATNVGTNVNTYTSVAGDVGSTITVVVTATNAGGNASATSAAVGPITASAVAPSNSVAPVISGSTVTGSVLTATNGTWAGSPTPTFSYQWKRGATNVGTGVNTYTTVVADEGLNITCVVTGTNTAGSANATSNALGPIAAAPSLPAPVLVWTSGPSVYDPVFTATFTAEVSDSLTIEIDDNSDFSSLFDSDVNVLDSAEVAAGTVTFAGITTLSGGVTYYARLKLQRGAASVYSNTVSQAMTAPDVTAPTLTSPLGSQIGSTTTAAIGVTTNEANGTLYYVVTTSATAPTAAQVKAGQNNAGTAAMYAGSQAISATGAKTATATGITTGTRYAYYMHEDAATNQSTVSASASWTQTVAAGATWTKKAGSIQDISYASTSLTIAAAPINNASASDVIVVCVNVGLPLAGVTIGGNTMTKVVEPTTGRVSIWQYTGTVFTTPDVIATTTSAAILAGAMTVGVLTGVNSAVPTGAALATKVEGFYANPLTTTTALTIPAGGFGIVAVNQPSVAGVTPNAGTTEDYDLTITVGGNPGGLWSGYMTATGTPSVDADPFIGSVMAAAAWGP
jgi:hypothetical protein